MPNEHPIVISSRVRLARNIKDLPFRSRMTGDQADDCIERVLSVLRDEEAVYHYFPMRGVRENQRQKMVESHLISPDLFKNDDRGAALIREDEKVVLMVNEEDHLRIQGFVTGLDIEAAAKAAYEAEDALQRKLCFAFDEQWGYLTACPTNTGTGMRASVMLHLPMLALLKQMGKVTQLAAKLGLTIRGFYGEGSEALGHVYQLSNQVTLGRTENEIVDAVTAVARQIEDMEKTCREKAFLKDPVSFEDQLERSMGIMCYARKMSLKEFFVHWSNLRMASAMGKNAVPLSVCDQLLRKAQRAHLLVEAGRELSEKEIDALRSDLIRDTLGMYR